MNLLAKAQHNIGNIITVPNVLSVLAKTYLNTNYPSTTTSLSVENTTDFVSPIRILIGALGNENSELVNVSAIPNQTTLTVSATQFNHTRGDSVSYVEYDQYVVEKSTTALGPWSALGTFSMQVNSLNTFIYDSVGTATTYYRITLRNSVSTLTSNPFPVFSPETYSQNSVGALFSEIRTLYGVQETDSQIDTTFLLSALNDARDNVNNGLYNFKQSWRQKFEHPIQLKAGWNYVELPSDYEQSDTNAMLLSVRYPRINGLSPYILNYIDKREWNQTAYSLKYTYSKTDTLVSATTIDVENVGDFQPNGGTVFVATNDFSETIMAVNYTGINYSTGQLTGVTGVTRAFIKGTQMFGFPTFSSATYYTVFDNKIWFNRPVPDVMQGRNLYIDYYKKLEPITDINTELVEPYAKMYSPWIRWSIKYRKDPSLNPKSDSDYLEFASNIQKIIDNYYTGQYPKIVTSGYAQ